MPRTRACRSLRGVSCRIGRGFQRRRKPHALVTLVLMGAMVLVVAGADELAAVAVRDQIDGVRRARGKHDLALFRAIRDARQKTKVVALRGR